MDNSRMIIQIRAHLNLTQEDLGKIVGVSFSTINRWENGKTIPSRKHLCVLENICLENGIDLGKN